MQTKEPVYIREATNSMVKIMDIAYVKEYLEHVAANATQFIYEDITQLLGIIKDFENFLMAI